jgi:hypothetical protein
MTGGVDGSRTRRFLLFKNQILTLFDAIRTKITGRRGQISKNRPLRPMVANWDNELGATASHKVQEYLYTREFSLERTLGPQKLRAGARKF